MSNLTGAIISQETQQINIFLTIQTTTDVSTIAKKAKLFHDGSVDGHSQKSSTLKKTKPAPPTKPKSVPTTCLRLTRMKGCY